MVWWTWINLSILWWLEPSFSSNHQFTLPLTLYIALSAKEELPNDSYNCGNSNSSLPCLSHPKKLPLNLFLNSVYWMLWGTEETFFFFFFWWTMSITLNCITVQSCTKLFRLNICRDMRHLKIGEIGVLYQKCLIN